MIDFTPITPAIHRLVIPFEDIFTTVFLVETPQGAVLFDTATYDRDAEEYILPALRAHGISAAALCYVVISHNHRDHGGSLGRILREFPDVCVVARSEKLRQKYAGASVFVPEDGEALLDVLRIVTIDGHTADCLGLLDTRTGTLLSGDCLQLYGIYGSGRWGANITMPAEHRQALNKLRALPLQTITASHDYHPCGHIARGGAEIARYLDACDEALDRIRGAILANPQLDDDTLAEAYNRTSSLPTVAPHVFAAMRRTMR